MNISSRLLLLLLDSPRYKMATLRANIGSEIAAYLASVSSANKSVQMRQLIETGLRTNELPVAGGIRMRDISTVNGLLENSKTTGFHDPRFLTKISDEVIGSIQRPSEGIRFMSNLCRLGIFDEKFVLQTLVRLMEIRKTEPLSPRDAAAIVNILSRQRIRLEEVIDELVSDNWTKLTVQEKIRTLVDTAALNIPTQVHINFNELPRDAAISTDLLQAFILRPDLMGSSELASSHLNFALATVSEHFSKHIASNSIHPAWHRKLLFVREAVRYVYPSSQDLLSDSSRAFLSLLSSMDNPRLSPRRAEDPMVKSVSDVLFKLKLKHDREVDVGPFSLDIQEAGRKLIWECDTPNRFYVGSDAKMKTAYYSLREGILAGMGYKVISVPHWHWVRITSPAMRADYCRMSRHLAIASSATPETSSFNGEYIFKKSMPRRSWAWHGHSAMPVRITI